MTIFLLFFNFNAFILNDSDVSTLDAVLFLSYGMLGVFVFGNANIRNPLYDTPFFRSIPRYALFFFVALVFFYFFLGVVNPFPNAVIGIFTGVNLLMLGFFLFIVSTT